MRRIERWPDEGAPEDDFGFPGWEDDGATDPETEAIIRELSVPVERPPARIIAKELHTSLLSESQERLAELAVVGASGLTESDIRGLRELQMTPHVLDDVHYVVYSRLKRGPQDPLNRYVSVSLDDILTEFDSAHRSGTYSAHMQRSQNNRALQFLAGTLKIDDDSLYEVQGSSSKGRFVLRSLHRLLYEESMRPYTRAILKSSRRRDERPLVFQDIALRAPNFLKKKLNNHLAADKSLLSSDQLILYNLIGRDLARTRGFARPIRNYMAATNPEADEPSEDSVIPTE